MRPLDAALDELKEELITMAGFVEEAVHLSIRVWKERNLTFVQSVFDIEDHVNRLHKEVDATCLKLLATQAPMAKDLRFVLATVKINCDLERMVDQAVNIVKNTEYYLRSPQGFALEDLLQMSEEVRFMVREAIDAFVRHDSLLATNVIRCDDKVDQFKDKILTDTVQVMKEKPQQVEQGLALILIARNLERIGDHATNIAEDVVFTESGEDIRHQGKNKIGG